MASTPQYGGDGVVEELDLGQPGSARAAANQAKYTVHVRELFVPPRIVTNELPQNTAAFQDVLGGAFGRFEWNGTLKVDSIVTWLNIRFQILKLLDGYARTASGDLGAFDPINVKPTTLKDGFGATVSTHARLVAWRPGNRIRKITGNATFNYLMDLSLTFGTLG